MSRTHPTKWAREMPPASRAIVRGFVEQWKKSIGATEDEAPNDETNTNILMAG